MATKNAKAARRWKEKRKAEGWVRISIWVPPEYVSKVRSILEEWRDKWS